MKFSDMMGKADGAETEEVAAPTSDVVAAPPAPEAPIQFGEQRVRTAAEPRPAAPPDLTPESRLPSIAEVAAELAPRNEPAAASVQQVAASAWLEDLSGIDDDLLPT